MCGIIGVVARSPVNQLLYDGLLLLQHRGQDAAGIVTADGPALPHAQGPRPGARRVPHARHALAAGHHRHRATAAIRPPVRRSSAAEAQPFYVNSPFGIVLGAQRQPDQLRRSSSRRCSARTCATSTPTPTRRCCSTCSRTSCEDAATGHALDPETIFKAVAGVHRRCRGAYAVVAMIAGYGAARLPRSVRHPAAGDRPQRHRRRAPSTSSPRRAWRSTRSASSVVRDVAPGEAIFIDEDGKLLQPPVRAKRRRSTRASSSTCTSRGPTR